MCGPVGAAFNSPRLAPARVGPVLIRHVRTVALSAAAVFVVTTFAGWDPTALTAGRGPGDVVVRVDQAVYGAGETKVAVVLGAEDSLAGRGFHGIRRLAPRCSDGSARPPHDELELALACTLWTCPRSPQPAPTL